MSYELWIVCFIFFCLFFIWKCTVSFLKWEIKKKRKIQEFKERERKRKKNKNTLQWWIIFQLSSHLLHKQTSECVFEGTTIFWLFLVVKEKETASLFSSVNLVLSISLKFLVFSSDFSKMKHCQRLFRMKHSEWFKLKHRNKTTNLFLIQINNNRL